MAENEKKQKRSLYTSEIVLYSIFGAFWIVGFVFAILGLFAYNYGKLSENSLYALQKSFATFFKMKSTVMDFRLWGTIIMVVMMVCFLITVFAYANRAEKQAAEERRRAERMRILMEADEAESK